MESKCVSINTGPPINGKMVCELSNSDHRRHSEDLKAKEGFMYRATQVRKANLVFCFFFLTTTTTTTTATATTTIIIAATTTKTTITRASVYVCDQHLGYLVRTRVPVLLACIMGDA